MAISTSALFLVSMAVTAFVSVVGTSVTVWSTVMTSALAWAAGFVLDFTVFMLLYRLMPYIRPSCRRVLPGAILATVLFELVRGAFIFYLDNIANYEMVYGALASVAVFLIWVYVSALILITGAVFNVAYQDACGNSMTQLMERKDESKNGHHTG